ncbi:MAG: helix-turn-helix transcriptional regulator [Pseudomonadota bacterium]
MRAVDRTGAGISLDRLAGTVDQLGKPGFAAALGDAAAGFIDFDNLIILAYSGAATPQELYRRFVSPVPYAQIEETYLTSHYVLDPFYAAHQQKVPRGLYRLEDVAPDKFRATTYFTEYYQRTTLVDELALFAYTATGWTITACFARDHTSGKRFERRQIELFAKVARTLSALMEQHWAHLNPPKATLAPQKRDIIADLAHQLQTRHDISLTPRQVEVGLLILRGHSSRSAALTLGISWQTVKVFRKQLYSRCGVSSQAELFAILLPLIGETQPMAELA